MHFKTEILLQNMQIYASLYHKCNFPPFLTYFPTRVLGKIL